MLGWVDSLTEGQRSTVMFLSLLGVVWSRSPRAAFNGGICYSAALAAFSISAATSSRELGLWDFWVWP